MATEARRSFGTCIGYDLHYTSLSLGAVSAWQAALFFFEATGYRRGHQRHSRLQLCRMAGASQGLPPLGESNFNYSALRTTGLGQGSPQQVGYPSFRSRNGQVLTARKRGFGSASTRTAEDKCSAKAETIRIMASLPPNTAICFLDGSCPGNPGPCGTGGLVFMPGEVEPGTSPEREMVARHGSAPHAHHAHTSTSGARLSAHSAGGSLPALGK